MTTTHICPATGLDLEGARVGVCSLCGAHLVNHTMGDRLPYCPACPDAPAQPEAAVATNNFGTGISEWLGGHGYEIVSVLGPTGEPDQQVTIIRREDGVLAGVTNGDPIWNDECEELLRSQSE